MTFWGILFTFKKGRRMRPALLSINWLLALEQSRARVLESWDFQNFFSVAKESLLIFFLRVVSFCFP